MKRRQFIGVLGTASLALYADPVLPQKKPKYVFFMIGDGMGVAQREAAERYTCLKQGEPVRKLAMNQLPVRGLTTTVEVTGKITDSAAAGTALACGVKTVNGVLGIGPDLKTPLRSMAFDARDSGKKVGIVTSVPIDHATPAAFYAQVTNRRAYYEIDECLAKSGFDYFAGEPMLGRKAAKGKISPEKLMQNAGYRLVGDRVAFDSLKEGDRRILVEQELGYAIDGPQTISLADYTRKGIELLDGDKGFFMMVEGGKIDWSGHANDLATNIHETLAFDDAVQVALDFCRKHPGESLLVVTADHETGGLQLNPVAPAGMVAVIDAQEHQSADYVDQVNRWKKSGTVSPDEAYDRLIESFSFSDLSPQSATHLRSAVQSSLAKSKSDTRDPEIQKMYGKRNAAVVSCLHEVAGRAGADWTSFNHTDTRVQTTAFGNGAVLFGGPTDNTDLGQRLKNLLRR